MKIILASNSPRRHDLLKQIVDDFVILCSQKEEDHPDLPPKKFVQLLSFNKAKDVFDRTSQFDDRLVVGSDTIVVLDGKIIGKPKDKADADSILKRLSNRTHTVFTGVCLMSVAKTKCFTVKSRVKFFELTQSQIDAYIDTGSPMDKAGAYGIQDSGFVKKIYGSKSCVMGLPLEALSKQLKKISK